MLNYSFFFTFLFYKTIVEQISTITAIRIFRNEIFYERTRGIAEIISTLYLNPVNVEL